MKALAIIIQTKRGENAFVVTSNNFTQELAQEYSHAIYNVIIKSYKKSSTVDRTFLFKRDLSAICNISKDMIIQVIVPNTDIHYGIECLKKANELLTKHTKNETTLKKYTEIFSNLEELIYSRDYSTIKLQLSLKPSEIQSAKKSIDLDIFAKFPLLNHDGEKSLIQTVPLKYSKRAFTYHREAHLRYQVAKTCQFAVNPSISNETQLKRFYRHNLSNQAFNKSQPKPNNQAKMSRQSTMPKTTFNVNPIPANTTLPTFVPMNIVNDQKPIIQPEPVKGLSDIDLDFLGKASENKSNNNKFNPMDLYSNSSPIYNVSNQGSASGSTLPNPDRPKKKIFGDISDRKDIKAEGSFNTFSHDLFNTVSLPAQMNNQVDQSPNRMQQFDSQRGDPMAQTFGNPTAGSLSAIPHDTDDLAVSFIKLLKIMEKFYLTLQNSKVQNLKIVGQVAIEIENNDEASLPPLSVYLSPSSFWDDETKIIKRPSRKDLIVKSLGSFSTLQMGRMKGNVPLFDYLVNQKSFDTNRIPIFFIYKVESAGEGKSSIIMQYKINEKLQQTFYEVEITANFKVDLSGFEVKTMPTANKIAERSATWRAKSLGSDSKGKLCITLENCFEPAGRFLEEIKITLKGLALVHDEMDAYASFYPNALPQHFKDPSIFKAAQKRQIIEYKVLANDQ